MAAIELAEHSGLALDIGERRIGVASANLDVRFAYPLTTLEQPETFIDDIIALCRRHDAAWLVLGLPRGLDSQPTAQTARVQAFGQLLATRLAAANLQVSLHFTDEALTSVKAEAELRSRRKPYHKIDIDALAATYILEDFLHNMPATAPLAERTSKQ
jgi:putative Holliday junction resolvase